MNCVYEAIITLQCDDSKRTVCCSSRKDIIIEYLRQWGYVYDDIEIVSTNVLYYPKELIPFNSHFYLTRLEMMYYKNTFKIMYDDMKTTITSLIMYDKLGGYENSGIDNISEQREFIKKIYNSLESYDKYLDSLDFDRLKKFVFLDPVSAEHMMEESIKLDCEYRNILNI